MRLSEYLDPENAAGFTRQTLGRLADVDSFSDEQPGLSKEQWERHLREVWAGPVDPDEFSETLKMNSGKNFVQRAMNPTIFPALDNGNGSVSTHSMADGELNGIPAAYPTVVQSPGGELTRLNDDDALDFARRTGEYISFNTPQESSRFARGGYKTKKFNKGGMSLPASYR